MADDPLPVPAQLDIQFDEITVTDSRLESAERVLRPDRTPSPVSRDQMLFGESVVKAHFLSSLPVSLFHTKCSTESSPIGRIESVLIG